MRSKNVLFGSLSTALLNIVTLISGLVIPRLIILTFGSNINGLSNSITQFISYFTLIEAGLAGSAILALYKPLVNNDTDEINNILSAAKTYYYRIGAIYFFAVMLFSFLYGIFFANILGTINTILLALAIGIEGFLEFVTMAKYRVLLTAAQKTSAVSFASAVSIAFRVIVLYICIKIGLGIILIFAIDGSTILIRSLILHFYVKAKFKYVSYSKKTNASKLQQRGDVFIMQIMGSFQNAFPIVVMNIARINFSQISVFTVYASIISAVKTMVSVLLNGSIFSTFGNVIVNDDYELLGRVLGEFEVISYMFISILFGCTLILFMPFIIVYTHGMKDTNYIQSNLALILTISGFLNVIKYPLSAMIQAGGHYRKTRWRTITQTLILTVMSLVLVKPFGILGIIVGVICSDFYRTIDILIYVPKHITRTKTRISLKRVIIALISIVVVYIPFIFIKIKASSYLEWLLFAIVVFIWCMLIIFCVNFVFNKKEMRDLLIRLKSLRKK